jgi:hypothetical protein
VAIRVGERQRWSFVSDFGYSFGLEACNFRKSYNFEKIEKWPYMARKPNYHTVYLLLNF